MVNTMFGTTEDDVLASAVRQQTPVSLIAGSGHPALSDEIARLTGLDRAACEITRFPDGEVGVALEEPVRGHEVVIVQPTRPPVNEHLVELLALVDASRRAAAARIVAVLPYFGYARSDRRDGRRTPITASLVARLLETAGVDQVITLDVHAPAIEGFFRIPLDNLAAIPVLVDAVRPRIAPDAVVVAPDLGAAKRADRFAALLGLGVAVCHKQRASPTAVNVTRITGDVAGRPCVIVDDMIATGSTIAECARALRSAGALPAPLVVATHAVLVPGAATVLGAAGLAGIVVTDSIAGAAERGRGIAIDVVPVAPLLATAIERLLDGGSLRALA